MVYYKNKSVRSNCRPVILVKFLFEPSSVLLRSLLKIGNFPCNQALT